MFVLSHATNSTLLNLPSGSFIRLSGLELVRLGIDDDEFVFGVIAVHAGHLLVDQQFPDGRGLLRFAAEKEAAAEISGM